MKLLPILAILACLLACRPTRAEDGLEAELFPPEFFYAQREALGLSEAQLTAMNGVMEAASADFEKQKAELDTRARELAKVLHVPLPDPKVAEEKLRSLLTQEAEVKTLHMLTMLKVRAQLTAEQLEKARKLRDEIMARAAAQTAPQDRLEGKLAQLRDLAKARTDAGTLPPDTMDRAREIQDLLKNSREIEAEQKIDDLLKRLNAPAPK